MSSLAEFRSEFELLGYDRVSGIPVETKGDLWYKHKFSTEEINHFAFLRYLPSTKAYDPQFGITSKSVFSFVEKKETLVKKYIKNYKSKEDLTLFDRPCWVMYLMLRELSPVYTAIPHKNKGGQWRVDLNNLFHCCVEKKLFLINNLKELEILLLRDDFPFRWYPGQAILRIVEIIVLARFNKTNPDELRNKLLCFESVTSGEIYSNIDREIENTIEYKLQISLLKKFIVAVKEKSKDVKEIQNELNEIKIYKKSKTDMHNIYVEMLDDFFENLFFK